VIETVRDAQILLLSVVLVTAGLAKLVFRESPVQAEHSAHSAVVTLRHGRPLSIMLAGAEGMLGVALLVTAHPLVRLATVLGFAAAAWVVGELRANRPDGGCGCFGALSRTRVGMRSVVRTVFCTASAIVALGVPRSGLDVLHVSSGWVGVVLVTELTLFAWLSPEIGVLLTRLRDQPPCELRTGTLAKAYEVLYASDAWREHEDVVTKPTPIDVWRELCWHLLVFPGRVAGQDVEIVFAVSITERDPAVRTAVVTPEDALVARTNSGGTGPFAAIAI
jgi:methylamine utilization protein MauE